MKGLTKFSPKIVHSEMNEWSDFTASVISKIFIVKEALRSDRGPFIRYTIRERLEGNNKSIVGESYYEIDPQSNDYDVEMMHYICEDSRKWFKSEVNKILNVELPERKYNRDDMHDWLIEVLNSNISS